MAELVLITDLIAVLVAVEGNAPRVLTVPAPEDDQDQDAETERALPSGPLEPEHRSLQSGMRNWVERQTQHPLGHIEQLYTFADRDRGSGSMRAVSISYLGLTRIAETHRGWRSWYRYFPWEDRRGEAGEAAVVALTPLLRAWWEEPAGAVRIERRNRCRVAFALDGAAWDEELVLQRYELLYEIGLVAEAEERQTRWRAMLDACAPGVLGARMWHDHRRILATAIARLRAKIQYRPVVFELMPDRFTLLQLQQAVEALAGRRVHKQNFRRLIEQQDLVEETGDVFSAPAGRPAKLFRFRRDVLLERQAAGTKLPLRR